MTQAVDKSTAELKLCPFCGSKAEWAEDGEQKQKYGNDQAYCPNCYASAAPDLGKEVAAEWWNARYDTSQERIERLEAALKPFTQMGDMACAGDTHVACSVRLADIDVARAALAAE